MRRCHPPLFFLFHYPLLKSTINQSIPDDITLAFLRSGFGNRKKQTQKKKQHHIPWLPMYPANQQNVDIKLATAQLLLAIQSARNSAEALKTLHRDCLTVWIIECMETYSGDLHDQLFFFFFFNASRLSEINTRDRQETKKKNDMAFGVQTKSCTVGRMYMQAMTSYRNSWLGPGR